MKQVNQNGTSNTYWIKIELKISKTISTSPMINTKENKRFWKVGKRRLIKKRKATTDRIIKEQIAYSNL